VFTTPASVAQRINMHDLHLADKIIKQVLEFAAANGFKKVRKVWVELGPIIEHEVEIGTDNLRFNLVLLSNGTIARGAEFDIKKLGEEGKYIIKEIEGE